MIRTILLSISMLFFSNFLVCNDVTTLNIPLKKHLPLIKKKVKIIETKKHQELFEKFVLILGSGFIGYKLSWMYIYSHLLLNKNMLLRNQVSKNKMLLKTYKIN